MPDGTVKKMSQENNALNQELKKLDDVLKAKLLVFFSFINYSAMNRVLDNLL